MATSKFTPEVQKKLVQMLRKGNYSEAACKIAGISYSTYRNWMLKGEQEPDSEYGAFREAVEAASGQAESDAVDSLLTASQDDYKAAVVYLERRFPERWAASQRINLQVDKKIGEFMTFLESKLPEVVFVQVAEAAASWAED